MYGALNTIPTDLEEAARIDGAGPVTIALRLKLPLIRKWIAYMVILSFATGTQLFVEPQLVNQASFGMVPDTWSSNQLAYQLAFRYADFNGAAAVSVDDQRLCSCKRMRSTVFARTRSGCSTLYFSTCSRKYQRSCSSASARRAASSASACAASTASTVTTAPV